MTGAAFSVTLDDAPIKSMLERLEMGIRDDRGLLAILGEYGVASTQARFATQASPEGTPWTPLNQAYADFKGAGYDILTGPSGALKSSQHFVLGMSLVAWGSNMIYAAVHQFGATIVPKSAGALFFRLGLGGVREVLAQSVTIPARPYLGISAEDAEEIVALTQDYFARLIAGY
jgi:phage virion morphogenesis protein